MKELINEKVEEFKKKNSDLANLSGTPDPECSYSVLDDLVDQYRQALTDISEEARKEGIEIARKYLRSSQENCMCNEKNHLQMDLAIKEHCTPQSPESV